LGARAVDRPTETSRKEVNLTTYDQWLGSTFTLFPDLSAADRFVLASVWVRINVDGERVRDVVEWARSQLKTNDRAHRRPRKLDDIQLRRLKRRDLAA